jgi:hypothetical protein
MLKQIFLYDCSNKEFMNFENKTENGFLNFQIHDYSSFYLNIELVVLSTLSFTLPIFLGHPQWLIGIIINFLLFRAALTMNFWRTLPVILLPSIGVFTAGVLFGGMTSYVLYFIPFIWLGNAIYVFAGKFVSHKLKKNYGLNVIAGSLIKSGLLFGTAFIMVQFFGFPGIFLTTMGIFQLVNALIGGFLATSITKIEMSFRE